MKIRAGAWRDDGAGLRWLVPARWGASASTFKRRRGRSARPRSERVPRRFSDRSDRCGSRLESSTGPSVVRDDSPFRRRQRPHSRGSPTRCWPAREEPATLLQHVGPDPARARRLLYDILEQSTAGNARRYTLDGVVPAASAAPSEGAHDHASPRVLSESPPRLIDQAASPLNDHASASSSTAWSTGSRAS